MTIDVPELDDKQFDELLEEATKRLPAYSDGWTDHNPSDPGITILELFAYLTDTYTYQLDAITDEHRRKYLGLLGERPRSYESASIQLSMSLPEGETQRTVPAGTKLTVLDGSDSDKIFETTDDIVLTDATIEAVVTEHGEGLTDHTQANMKEGMFYRAFGDRAEPPNALYLGLAEDPFDPNESLGLTVDFHEEELPSPAEHGDEQPRFYPSVSTVWEYCSDYERSHQADAWSRLSVARDGTYGFYRGGPITLNRPEQWDPETWGVDEYGVAGQEPGLFWLRCRVLEGGYEIAPQFDSIAVNVVTARHRSTVENEPLTRFRPGDGPATLTEQVYQFRHTPVLDTDVTVDGERWTEVESFDASGPTDRHYVLDSAAGLIRFGDGIQGRMPEPDASVVAKRYVAGGGRIGNVPASSTFRFLHPDTQIGDQFTLGDISVTAESPGTGGTDAESLDEAFRRTKRDLRTPYRAVTRSDYEYLATHTPGLRFGRATALVDELHDGADDGAVEVTVIVVPYVPLTQSRPTPSEGFLDAVQRHLDEHRLLTDRVTVQPPEYVGLTVEIEGQTNRWLSEANAQRAIESAISEYIHPIHGFEGDGWPFGRPLYSEEIRERIEAIEAIDLVREVSVRARGSARVDGDGNVLVDESALLALDEVRTDIRTVATDRDGA